MLELLIPDLEVRLEKGNQEIKALSQLSKDDVNLAEIIQTLHNDQSVEAFVVESKTHIPSDMTKK